MNGMWAIHLDAQMTRRKRFHLLYDEEDQLVIVSRDMGQVFEFLTERGVEELLAFDDDQVYLMTVTNKSHKQE